MYLKRTSIPSIIINRMWVANSKTFASTLQTADAIFIRHAESHYNKQTQKYLESKGLAYSWQTLGNDSEFLTNLKYGQKFIDCPITQRGIEQCKATREKLGNYQPDLILVSPLNRTLQTCSHIFQSAKCPVIVEPSLAESLRSSCDFSCDMKDKIQRFNHYNFEPTLKKGPFWFVRNESEQNQTQYQNIIDSTPDKDYKSQVKQLVDHMGKTKIYEKPVSMRQRTDTVKMMLKGYRKKYQKIAVISHHTTLRFLLAKEFDHNDEPVISAIANCEVRSANIDDL